MVYSCVVFLHTKQLPLQLLPCFTAAEFVHYQQRECSLLRIAESVLLASRYIASRKLPEFGAVCGAFADAVRDLLVDWKLYVTTLEKDLKGNGEWNLIRIMSSCQQVIDPLYTTACAFIPLCSRPVALLCSILDTQYLSACFVTAWLACASRESGFMVGWVLRLAIPRESCFYIDVCFTPHHAVLLLGCQLVLISSWYIAYKCRSVQR